MATSPARNPFTVKLTSHFLLNAYAANIDVMPAAQAARVVFAATRPIPIKSIADSVLPGLNPYHPNQRIKPPEAAMVRSWGSIGPPPSRLNLRPSLGPSTIAPASAMKPPIVCTTVEPAKSWKLAPTHAVRPIIAPEVIVEQVSAKANWKSQKARKATPVVS